MSTGHLSSVEVFNPVWGYIRINVYDHQRDIFNAWHVTVEEIADEKPKEPVNWKEEGF